MPISTSIGKPVQECDWLKIYLNELINKYTYIETFRMWNKSSSKEEKVQVNEIFIPQSYVLYEDVKSTLGDFQKPPRNDIINLVMRDVTNQLFSGNEPLNPAK